MNQLANIFSTRVKPWWSSLDSGARLQYSAVSIAAFVGIAVVLMLVFKPRYETLYMGLDPAEAGQVIEKLKADKVPYKLENGGTIISVPRKEIYDLRLRLASEGLPRSGTVGYEIFDKSNLGMTDFLQKVNFRRALEGELAKSICSINEVKSARVHLVIPEPRLFKEDNKETTASVILNLYGGRAVSSRQVEGIAFLVASSVEGLHPENVTILDASGRLLSNKNYGDGLTGLTSSQLELQKTVESYLESKAKSMLDPVIGEGRSVITVSAQLNFEQVEKTMENYDPDNLAVRSEEKNQEKTSEQNMKTDGQGKTVNNSTENTVTNYEVNKTVQHVVSQVGNISKLWVAAVVDGTYKSVAGPGGKPTQQYGPRSQEDIDKIASIVKGAVGYDPERNDVLEIANVPFENRQEPEEQMGFFSRERIDDWIEIGWKLLLVAAGLFLFLRVKRRLSEFWQKQKAETDRIMAEKEGIKKRDEIIPRLSGEPQLVDHLRAIASEKPAEIARVIKTMMVED